jgi:Uma2 family endonuclease
MQTFVGLHDLGTIRDETALVASTRNDYLTDILFFSKEKASSFSLDTWRYPIPDFIVEVLSDRKENNDRGIKKEDYASHGALEYWLVDPEQRFVEQYLLNKEKNR